MPARGARHRWPGQGIRAQRVVHGVSRIRKILVRRRCVFIYVVLDKQRANLALARRKTQDVDKQMDF